jgi:hypothetical protein
MKKFSIIHLPLMSFFSEALYRDVGLHWKGTGFNVRGRQHAPVS